MYDPSKNRLIISLILMIALTVITMIAVVYAFLQGLQEPISSVKIKEGTLIQVTAEVVINQSMEIGLPNGRVVVYIPANAISKAGWFALSSKDPDLFPESSQKVWSRPVIANLELFDQNSRIIQKPTFLEPLEICFSLEVKDWEEYQVKSGDYKIQYLEDGENVWEDLPMSNRPEKRMICGEFETLGLFALAILPPPESVSTPAGLYAP